MAKWVENWKSWKKSKKVEKVEKVEKPREKSGKTKGRGKKGKTSSKNVVLVESVGFRVNTITETVFGAQNVKEHG
ncbi:MAG: hypothetical protein EOO61_17225 [Hymenobacter sp.]|nr:MAG: hypothetical protein EOO61_17225 [Hymenobacter sp.]